MDPEAIQLLREIRDETRQTNARLDQTIDRLDQTVGRLDQTIVGVEGLNLSLIHI